MNTTAPRQRLPKTSCLTAVERTGRTAPPSRFARSRFSADAQGPAAARRWTRRHLRAWGLERQEDEALLVVSELVTNASAFGGSVGLAMRVQQGPDAGPILRIEVQDTGTGLPPDFRARRPGHDACSGRGLLLVSDLAAQWGSHHTSRGTWSGPN
ncbi:ATP-binding protein [Streptomyces anulatus]|uniref:ATP-binding protein n=1 Tax=Streptomyces anulatus TaxID=1892 RepID=UPI0033CE9F8A